MAHQIRTYTPSIAELAMETKLTDAVAAIEKMRAPSLALQRMTAPSLALKSAVAVASAVPSVRLEQGKVASALRAASTARYQSQILGLSSSLAASHSHLLAFSELSRNIQATMALSNLFGFDSAALRYPLGKPVYSALAFGSLVTSKALLGGYRVPSISDSLARQMSYLADPATAAYAEAPVSVRAAVEVEAVTGSPGAADVITAIAELTEVMRQRPKLTRRDWIVFWLTVLTFASGHGPEWVLHELEHVLALLWSW